MGAAYKVADATKDHLLIILPSYTGKLGDDDTDFHDDEDHPLTELKPRICSIVHIKQKPAKVTAITHNLWETGKV
jgi:hypothetical protein